MIILFFLLGEWKYSRTCVPAVMCSAEFVKAQKRNIRLGMGINESTRLPTGEDRTCLVCQENAATRLAVPCGHRTCCRPCLWKIVNRKHRELIEDGTYSQYEVPITCFQCRALVAVFSPVF